MPDLLLMEVAKYLRILLPTDLGDDASLEVARFYAWLLVIRAETEDADERQRKTQMVGLDLLDHLCQLVEELPRTE